MVKRNQILIRLVLLVTHEQPRLDWGLSPHLRRNVQWGQTPTIEEISAANGGIVVCFYTDLMVCPQFFMS